MKKLLGLLLLVPLMSQAQLKVSIQISDPPKCATSATGVLTAAVTGGNAPYVFLWNTGASSQVVYNQPAGKFWVRVTDKLGIVVSDTAIIVAPDSIKVSNIIIPADHWGNQNGGNNGAIQLTTIGGISPYSYQYQLLRYTPMTTASAQSTMIGASALNAYWLGVDSTNKKYSVEDPSNLAPGTYKLVITDGNGCKIEDTLTVPNLHPINTNSAKDTTNCWESRDGQSGLGHIYGQGSHPFAYINSNSPSTIIWMYDASFTDGLGVFHHVDSLQNGTLILDADTSVVFANGAFVGYNPANVKFQINPTRVLSTGFYQGFWWTKIVSAEGYENIMYGTNTQPQSPLSLSVSFGTILCFGGTSYAEGLVDGSYGNYTWKWSSGEKTAKINDKPADSYAVTVTDKNGCWKTESGKLTHPPRLKSKINLERPVACFGDSTAKAVAEVSGGEGVITTTWSESLGGPVVFTGEIFQKLWAGKWYLHMIDKNNCQSDDSIIITQPDPLKLTVDKTTNISCFGEINGEVMMHPDGGTMPITGSVFRDKILFDYFRPQMFKLPAGEYKTEIVDNNGCIDSAIFHITQPADILIKKEVSSAICYGDSSGKIKVDVSGGTEAFSILWNDQNTEFNRSVPQGTYSATITDINTGCTKEINIIIDQPDQPQINTSILGRAVTEGMTDGELKIDNVFFLDPKSFTLLNVSTDKIETEFYLDKYTGYPTYTGLDSGSYVLTIISDLGCIAQISIYLPITNRQVKMDIPEEFSPNGDGINDTWNWPEFYEESCKKIVIYFDGNGAEVYHREGPYTDPWNGKWDNTGDLCPEGKPYLYVLTYDDKGKEKVIKHFVVVTRKKK